MSDVELTELVFHHILVLWKSRGVLQNVLHRANRVQLGLNTEKKIPPANSVPELFSCSRFEICLQKESLDIVAAYLASIHFSSVFIQ